jgi:hypothetical protein
MKRVSQPKLTPDRLRTGEAASEWLAKARDLAALEFLERSRDLAAEAVIATPVRVPLGKEVK